MGLMQIKESDRIIFFNRFTREILINLYREEETQKKIEIEKLRQKFINPNLPLERKPMIHRENIIPIPIYDRPLVRSISHNQPIQQGTKPIPPSLGIKAPSASQQKPIKPIGNPLLKIDPLMRDPTVLSIECSGPGKNIIVKRHDQINRTRIFLTQDEINYIINDFSKQAKIPLVGGLLKAAVGNSIITAVASDYAGSRFIINKMTPYSLLQKPK